MTLRSSSAFAMTVRSPTDYSTYESCLMPMCFVNLPPVGMFGRPSAAEKFYSKEEWELIQRMKHPKTTEVISGVDFAWKKTLDDIAQARPTSAKFLVSAETWKDLTTQYAIDGEATIMISGAATPSYNGKHFVLAIENHGSLGSCQVTSTRKTRATRPRMT
jgi:hypothetical protein